MIILQTNDKYNIDYDLNKVSLILKPKKFRH